MSERNEDAAGLSEDLNELRNQLGRVIVKLDYLAAGKAESYARQTGHQVPAVPAPTLAGAAAEAVAIGKSIEHYASLYAET